MLRQLFQRFIGDTSGETLRTTAKAAAIVGTFSIGSAWYLSDRMDAEKRVLDQLALNAAQGGKTGRAGIDMTTTGSITRGAQNVRIDPCGEPAKAR